MWRNAEYTRFPCCVFRSSTKWKQKNNFVTRLPQNLDSLYAALSKNINGLVKRTNEGTQTTNHGKSQKIQILIKAFIRFYKRPNKRNEFYVKEKHDFSQFGKSGPQSEPVGPCWALTQIPQIVVHSVSCHCLSLDSAEWIVMDWQGAQQAPVVSCLQQTGGSRSEPGIIQEIW